MLTSPAGSKELLSGTRNEKNDIKFRTVTNFGDFKEAQLSQNSNPNFYTETTMSPSSSRPLFPKVTESRNCFLPDDNINRSQLQKNQQIIKHLNLHLKHDNASPPDHQEITKDMMNTFGAMISPKAKTLFSKRKRTQVIKMKEDKQLVRECCTKEEDGSMRLRSQKLQKCKYQYQLKKE